MNKLPKEIYVDENADEPIFFINAEECAEFGETVTLGVYKLVGKVEVSTEMRREIVVKKSPKKAAAAKAEPVQIDVPDREKLLQEMRVTENMTS